MPSGGRVILLSTCVSTWSAVPPPYLIYAMTKGAVDQMIRLLAKDLGKRGITVNAVAPGPTGTDLFYEGKPQALIDNIKSLSPFNRLGKPEEIANAIAFVASDQSSWVSGQVIRVNGGNQV
jgi:3-oxoacyl-[acyl-carrier protein] reductase